MQKEIQWQNPNDLECVGLNMILSPQMSYTLVVIYHAFFKHFMINSRRYYVNVISRKRSL